MSEPIVSGGMTIDSRLDALERRLGSVEDVLAITRLVIAYGFATDTGNSAAAEKTWTADGVFDRGAGLDGGDGGALIAARLSRPEHLDLIRNGIVHFTGVPHVVVEGDRATATHYQQIIVPNETAEPIGLAAHGSSRGYRMHRVTANRWEFVRSNDGWRVQRRTLRLLDLEAGRDIIRNGLVNGHPDAERA
jgi:hypothetical protein